MLSRPDSDGSRHVSRHDGRLGWVRIAPYRRPGDTRSQIIALDYLVAWIGADLSSGPRPFP